MAKVTKSPVQRQARIPGDRAEKDAPCRESITTTMDGESLYDTVASNETCSAPTPRAKAEADANARDNLEAYGKVWCNKGDGKCLSNSCVPTLKDIKNQGYKMESRRKEAKKLCVVIATISGTVSCSCN